MLNVYYRANADSPWVFYSGANSDAAANATVAELQASGYATQIVPGNGVAGTSSSANVVTPGAASYDSTSYVNSSGGWYGRGGSGWYGGGGGWYGGGGGWTGGGGFRHADRWHHDDQHHEHSHEASHHGAQHPTRHPHQRAAAHQTHPHAHHGAHHNAHHGHSHSHSHSHSHGHGHGHHGKK
ncbi:hypothetical protein [Aquisphaera insulae]|uniref:hypothetical protein n=1 Tax=Aquisphaera insulae TaxID=2712864 RepID=UPI0013ED538A|nr:hypothetical protein [Aquisphaera insulae]